MILDSSLLNWVEREFGFSFCSHESQYSCAPLSHCHARGSLLARSAGAAFSFNSFLMPATWGSIAFHRLRLFHKIVSPPHFRCQFRISHCLLPLPLLERLSVGVPVSLLLGSVRMPARLADVREVNFWFVLEDADTQPGGGMYRVRCGRAWRCGTTL